MSQNIPRRIRLDLMTAEELAIYKMVGEIEKLGAHPLLTNVVVQLQAARSSLSDWVDLQIETHDKVFTDWFDAHDNELSVMDPEDIARAAFLAGMQAKKE